MASARAAAASASGRSAAIGGPRSPGGPRLAPPKAAASSKAPPALAAASPLVEGAGAALAGLSGSAARTGTQLVGLLGSAASTVLPSPAAAEARPVLSCAGGGIFFFWEAGVIKYLSEHYDLSRAQLVGASAGGLIAVLAACGVSTDRAVAEAHALSLEAGIWERPAGLAGVWGGLIRRWLDRLLPGDAAARCAGRVKVVATQVPSLQLCYLEDFASRDDLIDATMASAHIPFFLDGNAAYSYQGRPYIDGSLWDFLKSDNSELIKCYGKACVIDYFNDDELQYSRLDFIKLAQYSEVLGLMRAGYAYAARMDARGGFDSTLGSLRKGALRRALEAPVRSLGRLLVPEV